MKQQFISAITAMHVHQRVIAKIENHFYVISSMQDVELGLDILVKSLRVQELMLNNHC